MVLLIYYYYYYYYLVLNMFFNKAYFKNKII